MAHVPRGRHVEDVAPGEAFAIAARTVTEGVAVRNRRDETACEAEWTTLMARRR